MSNGFAVDIYSQIVNQETDGERKEQALQVRQQRQQRFTDALSAHLEREWAVKQALHSNLRERRSGKGAQAQYLHYGQTLTKDLVPDDY